MIGIKINGQLLKLLPDTTIDLDIDCDIFNFNEIEGTYSFPFTVPNDKEGHNRSIFGFADILESTSFHKDQEYKNVELMFAGNMLFSGSVYLEEFDGENFEIYFSTGASEVSAYSEKKLQEIITTVLDHGLTEAQFKAKYVNADLEFVFPWIYFREDYHIMNQSSDNNISPQFKLWYVIEKLFAEIGYPARDKGLFKSSLFKNIILFSNASYLYRKNRRGEAAEFSSKIDVKNYMPDITFNDFIKGLRVLFGLLFIFDSRKKECVIKLFKDIVNSTDHIDWTNKVLVNPDVKNEKYDPLIFAFDIKENYTRLGDNPSEQDLEEYTKLAPVHVLSDLPDPDDFNKICLVLDQNAWYRLNYENSDRDRPRRGAEPDWVWEQFSDAVLPYHEVGKDGMELRSKLIPMRRDEAFVRGLANVKIRNSSGKVRISYTNVTRADRPRGGRGFTPATTTRGWDPPVRAIKVGDYVKITNPQDMETDWAICTDAKTDGLTKDQWADIDLDYTDDADGAEVSVREHYGYSLPDWKGPYGGFRSTAPPYLLLYHGVQPRGIGGVTYRMASPDNYNKYSPYEKIGPLALRWEGEDGLIEHFWKDFLQFRRKSAKVVTFKVKLEYKDLYNFDPTKKIIIRGTTYLVKKISVPLRMNGIGIAEVEMRKV